MIYRLNGLKLDHKKLQRMEYEGDIFFESLMKWMSTFSVSADKNSTESICDGVAMAQVNRNPFIYYNVFYSAQPCLMSK